MCAPRRGTCFLYFRFSSTFQLSKSHNVSEKLTLGQGSFYAVAATGIKKEEVHRQSTLRHENQFSNWSSSYLLAPLQSIFKIATRVILQKPNSGHLIHQLNNFQLVPISFKVRAEVLTMAYKTQDIISISSLTPLLPELALLHSIWAALAPCQVCFCLRNFSMGILCA